MVSFRNQPLGHGTSNKGNYVWSVNLNQPWLRRGSDDVKLNLDAALVEWSWQLRQPQNWR